VNWYPRNDLIRIFRDFGEERYASRIARAVVRAREGQPIESTFQLAAIIRSVIPSRAPQKILSRIFQAIRIEVNDELCHLKRGLQAAIEFLKPGGRIVVISYHSLEDRIVKAIFHQRSTGCICPPDLPVCGCGQREVLRIVTGKVIRPSPEEIEANPRAHSAKLRVAERLETTDLRRREEEP
jgi:16S rRNA (cytosine1402-N4)-methyltransferase